MFRRARRTYVAGRQGPGSIERRVLPNPRRLLHHRLRLFGLKLFLAVSVSVAGAVAGAGPRSPRCSRLRERLLSQPHRCYSDYFASY